jgi:hypothetical protein
MAEGRPDISAGVRGFEGPCLLYCGSDDLLRAEVVRCAALMPQARFVEIPASTTSPRCCAPTLFCPTSSTSLGVGAEPAGPDDRSALPQMLKPQRPLSAFDSLKRIASILGTAAA